MLIISSREFRDHQKKYFELAEKEQVIVQRSRNKAYAITPISESDRYFSNPEVLNHLRESMAQADNKEYGLVLDSAKDIDKYLGI